MRTSGGPLLILIATALAGSLEVRIAFDGDDAAVVDARLLDDDAARTPRPNGAHRLRALDADGKVLAEVAVPDPRHRSLVLPEGGGLEGRRDRGEARVRVPWPEGARRLQLDDDPPQPPPPLPVVSAPAGATVTPLLASGDSDARLDLVVLGDGYRADELDAFAADTDRIVDYLLGIEPYGDYAGLFNVWRIDRASAESGATHLGQGGVSRDTAYGCYYGCGGLDRLVCCDDPAVLTDVGALVPGADGILVLINDPAYGGSGGFTYATSYVDAPYGPQVAAHELGHTLVGLWDEYGYGIAGAGEGPNCSRDPDGTWDAWLGTDGVGAYPECSYNGLHRPTLEGCMMRTLQDDYCPVCRQEVVLAMYGAIGRLTERIAPLPGPVDHPPPPFEVTLAVPEAPLQVEWRLDGEVVHTGTTYAPDCFAADGVLSAVVADPTPWVRDDPEGRLEEEAGRWEVTGGACEAPGVDPGATTTPEAPDAEAALPMASCTCQGGPTSGFLGVLPLFLWFRRPSGATNA